MRLKKVSFPELLHRAREVKLAWEVRGRFFMGGVHLKIPSFDPAVIEALQLPDLQYCLDDKVLEALLLGETFMLNGDQERIERFEAESRGVFWADVLRAAPDIDIRMVWEPARLQHLTVLLLHAYIYGGPELDRLQLVVKNAILDWIGKNPFLLGPHYQSAMECGLRIPVFFYALKLLSNLELYEQNRIFATTYQHAWWISRRLSLYSSLGNHTVCEGAGLVFAGAMFGSHPEGKAWMRRGLALLGQELYHQILDDGGPAEQSLSYGRFVLDLYWLVVDFLEKSRLHDCGDWKPRLILGENFLEAFRDDQGHLPAIGDGDDGFAVAPGVHPQKDFEPAQVSCRTFPVAGYTLIRADSGLIFSFDHGPLGMAPLYNHGHADALSITLSVNGKQMLVDPGTYRYNGVPDYRRYFRGTGAHNTVTVDAKDQAVQETNFVWSHPARAGLLRASETSDGMILEGYHNGYGRLKNPVEHRRTVLFFEGRHFLIRDTFAGVGVHDFALNFHIHPKAEAEESHGWWVIEQDGERVFLRVLNGDHFNLIVGQESPPFGWFSPAYGIKQQSGVLSCFQKGEVKGIMFLTAICVGSSVDVEGLRQRAASI